MTGSNEFQFFWSEGPLNWVSQLCLRSFTRYSDVTVHLYSYDRDLNPDIPGVICHDASEYFPLEIYKRVKSIFEGPDNRFGYATAADLFRYKLLYEKGGWYFDTDCLLLKPLTPLFDRDYVFGWETATRVNNAVLKFPKGDVMLDQLYNEHVQSPVGDTWMSLFTQYLKKFNLIDRALPREYFYGINWLGQPHSSLLEEHEYILHCFASTKDPWFQSKFDPQVKSLEREIEMLNKSLSLRIARKIPFGKEIRKILIKDE